MYCWFGLLDKYACIQIQKPSLTYPHSKDLYVTDSKEIEMETTEQDMLFFIVLLTFYTMKLNGRDSIKAYCFLISMKNAYDGGHRTVNYYYLLNNLRYNLLLNDTYLVWRIRWLSPFLFAYSVNSSFQLDL